MKKFFLILTSLVLGTVLFSGCFAVIVGAGVAGGIAISQDTVRLQANTTYERAWNTAHTALDKMGIINSEDQKAGTVVATIEESHVVAKVSLIAPRVVRIEVKARKNLLPNVDLASKIINDINNRLHSLL